MQMPSNPNPAFEKASPEAGGSQFERFISRIEHVIP